MVNFIQGSDNVFVWDTVPDHVIDHVAMDFREASNAAIAADLAWLRISGHWVRFDDGGRGGGRGTWHGETVGRCFGEGRRSIFRWVAELDFARRRCVFDCRAGKRCL